LKKRLDCNFRVCLEKRIQRLKKKREPRKALLNKKREKKMGGEQDGTEMRIPHNPSSGGKKKKWTISCPGGGRGHNPP